MGGLYNCHQRSLINVTHVTIKRCQRFPLNHLPDACDKKNTSKHNQHTLIILVEKRRFGERREREKRGGERINGFRLSDLLLFAHQLDVIWRAGNWSVSVCPGFFLCVRACVPKGSWQVSNERVKQHRQFFTLPNCEYTHTHVVQ